MSGHRLMRVAALLIDLSILLCLVAMLVRAFTGINFLILLAVTAVIYILVLSEGLLGCLSIGKRILGFSLAVDRLPRLAMVERVMGIVSLRMLEPSRNGTVFERDERSGIVFHNAVVDTGEWLIEYQQPDGSTGRVCLQNYAQFRQGGLFHIGRDATWADLLLLDETLKDSGRHCALKRHEKVLECHSLGRNGLMINGRFLEQGQSTVLRDRSRVVFPSGAHLFITSRSSSAATGTVILPKSRTRRRAQRNRASRTHGALIGMLLGSRPSVGVQ